MTAYMPVLTSWGTHWIVRVGAWEDRIQPAEPPIALLIWQVDAKDYANYGTRDQRRAEGF